MWPAPLSLQTTVNTLVLRRTSRSTVTYTITQAHTHTRTHAHAHKRTHKHTCMNMTEDGPRSALVWMLQVADASAEYLPLYQARKVFLLTRELCAVPAIGEQTARF